MHTDNSPNLLTFQYPCDQVKLWVHYGDVIQMYDCVVLTIKVSLLHDFHSGVHNVTLLTGCQDFWASEPSRAENKSNRLILCNLWTYTLFYWAINVTWLPKRIDWTQLFLPCIWAIPENMAFWNSKDKVGSWTGNPKASGRQLHCTIGIQMV